MNCEERYNKLVEAIKVLQEANPSDESIQNWVHDNVPELAESKDEKIRKTIYGWIYTQPSQFFDNGFSKEEMLAWLEKQDGQRSNLPKWRYKRDDTPLLRDSLILNKYGCVLKALSGALISDAWVLDYEELAKLPKEESEKQEEQKVTVVDFKAKDWYVSEVDGKIHNVTYIENTDEEIKRGLIEYFQGHERIYDKLIGTITIKEVLAWLENQGDQKPVTWSEDDEKMKLLIKGCVNAADMTPEGKKEIFAWLEKQGKETDNIVKPKFKVGDWITSQKGKCYQIKSIYNVDGGYYIVTDKDGEDNRICFSIANEYFHLWTIEDAKNGDVLIKEETEEPFIYNGNRGTYMPEFVGGYCGIRDGEFTSNGSTYYWGRPSCPATKEQRDLLFHKMKAEGYEWDADKKELKKIESKTLDINQIKKQDGQKTADKAEPKFKVGDWITDGYIHCKITEILDDRYIIESKYDKRGAILFEYENRYHLWTIADAKDGDVLVNGSYIFIFHFINDTRLLGYCHVNTNNGRFYDDIGRYECFCLIDGVVNPATKEQCDTLFTKMKEAGYKWDSENKELTTIGKVLNSDDVNKWFNEHTCMGWIKDTEVDEFIDKFKKHFGL